VDVMLGGVVEAGPRPEETGLVEATSVLPNAPDRGRRRFTYSALIGTVVASVPFLWILTNDWTGKFSLLRSNAGPDYYYDLQAQSMIHGHLWVPTGSLGIEGFLHGGRTYTYFGLLLSLLRIPIVLVAPNSMGHLTGPSILVAWLLTGLFSALLIWRVRILLRGSTALGWAEAVSFGVLMATIMGGSVLLYLASAPTVLDEDFAWTVPITVATLFVFCGILDRPFTGRVVAAGALVLAGALERPPGALACIVGAFLIAGWFFFGHGGAANKRWTLPMVAVGLVPAAAMSIVNWLKFGDFLNGVPLADQIWTSVNAHRHAFLAATGGKGVSPHFLPTMSWAYLQPFGLRAQSTFPFLSLPVHPPHIFGGYIVDTLYPTASVPASMPLFFLLSCFALVVCFRPGADRRARLLRIPLIAAAGATAVDFVYGYIAPRYLGDFLPFLVLGSAVGMVALWRLCEFRRRAVKVAAVAAVVALGVFSMMANIGLASTPTNRWTRQQATNYLQAAKAISDVTGHPLRRQIQRGWVLPYWAPANQIFVAGNCAGLYLSSGKRVETFIFPQLQHRTWVPVEQGSGIDTTLKITFNSPPSKLGVGVPLLTIGQDTIVVRPARDGGVKFVLRDRQYPAIGSSFTPMLGVPYEVHLRTDPFLQRVSIHTGPTTLLTGVLFSVNPRDAQVVVHTMAPAVSGPLTPLTVVNEPMPKPNMSLCRSLLNDR